MKIRNRPQGAQPMPITKANLIDSIYNNLDLQKQESGLTGSFTQIATISRFPGVIGARDTLTTSRSALNLDLHIEAPRCHHNILRSDYS